MLKLSYSYIDVARTPNNVRTIGIHISTTPIIQQYLEDLVASGLYGKNMAEAAERLVGRGIDILIHDGTLHRRGGTK